MCNIGRWRKKKIKQIQVSLDEKKQKKKAKKKHLLRWPPEVSESYQQSATKFIKHKPNDIFFYL